MKRFILVGADPAASNVDHPGGQLTASAGLIEYGRQHGYIVDVIDTSQSSFPVPSLGVRLKKGWIRLAHLNSMLSTDQWAGVVIFSSSGFSFYERILMAAVSRMRGIKVMFFMRSGHFMNSVNGSFLNRLFASLLLRVPSCIGAQGRPWVDFYQSLGVPSNKISVVRNWISADFPIAQNPKNRLRGKSINFLYVGWLVDAKGIRELLIAAEHLIHKYQFTLTLIGGGTLTEFAIEKSRMSLVGCLEVLGWQDSLKVQEHLAAADVFVLPSLAEGFPNALLEAMAMGLPSICTDVGAVADSLYDEVNGFLLPNNNPESIALAMEAYLANPGLLVSHSEKTLEIFKRQHQWESNCSELFNKFIEENS